MKKTYFIIGIFFILIGCRNEEKKGNLKHELPTVFPKISNPLNIKYKSTFEEENPTWISTADYYFNYLGKLNDSISLKEISFSALETSETSKKDSKIKTKKRLYEDYYIEWDKENRYSFMGEPKIEIQISSEKINNFYPALLRNRTKDTIQIGYGNILPLILEAKNKSGEWKPIQEEFVYECGNGVGTIILPPNEIAITLVPIFNGNYRTQLRLSMGNNKSNPFWGKINYRQFESLFDENGNYKEEYNKEMKIKENNDR